MTFVCPQYEICSFTLLNTNASQVQTFLLPSLRWLGQNGESQRMTSPVWWLVHAISCEWRWSANIFQSIDQFSFNIYHIYQNIPLALLTPILCDKFLEVVKGFTEAWPIKSYRENIFWRFLIILIEHKSSFTICFKRNYKKPLMYI